MTAPHIPVLLLKTRSQPDDGYEEYFNNLKPSPSQRTNTEPVSTTPSTTFSPQFIPVLEHQPNTTTLAQLSDLIRSNNLIRTYGGIIFTSQRAVEGFSSVIHALDSEASSSRPPTTTATTTSNFATSNFATSNFATSNFATSNFATSNFATSNFATSSTAPPPASDPRTPTPQTPFPLYTVGPATARALSALLPSPTLSPLHPTILGAHTGSGALLAPFILQHYNALHSQLLFTHYTAPRLPFIPLLGPASGQYARSARLEWGDERLRKRELLFLVGEQRRDVIPRMLGGAEGPVEGVGECSEEGTKGREKGRRLERRVGVVEWEVYGTVVRGEFGGVFAETLRGFELNGGVGRGKEVVVVVFSPQGCEAMLRGVGLLREGEGKVDEDVVRRRWNEEGTAVRNEEGDHREKTVRHVIATIGPTTRDYLRDTFGFEPDVCAEKPTPEGVGKGVLRFLEEKGLI